MELFRDWNKIINDHILALNTYLLNSYNLYQSYNKRNKNRSEIGFNAFTISSDLYYRENFHSDIMKSFLDPHEKHNEGNKYLHNFIDLLNNLNGSLQVQKDNFKDSKVERERHNIDILITDSISNKAIIIENKINNAVDQQRQLPKYVDIIQSMEYDIVGIVYLTLNSSKRPDKNDWTDYELNEINSKLKLIPAYDIDETKINLYNHWIAPSILDSSNIDSSSLLRQYGNLIKYLNTNTMDTISLEKFYNSIKKDDNLKTAISIRNMLNDLPEYLAIRIEEKYREKCYPFKYVWRNKLRDTVFEGFELGNLSFKIDVWCDIEGYTVHFWEINDPNYDIINGFKDKLSILSDFVIHDNQRNNIKKRYSIFEEEELFRFIDNFIEELIKIEESEK